MTNVWILHVEITHPDYKRPYVESHIETFSSEQRARRRLRHYQVEYIRGWDLDKDLFEDDEKMDKWARDLYSDGYMDQPPFTGYVWEAKYEDELVDTDTDDDDENENEK